MNWKETKQTGNCCCGHYQLIAIFTTQRKGCRTLTNIISIKIDWSACTTIGARIWGAGYKQNQSVVWNSWVLLLTILPVDDGDHANDEKNQRIDSVIHLKILSNGILKIIIAFISFIAVYHDDIGGKKQA